MRLTIVSPSAYPALVPGRFQFAGGAEFQLLMLARAMLDRGHEISFVVGNFGQPAVETAQGFTVYRSFELYRGNRMLRFVPDMIRLRAALRASAPDAVNQRSTAFYTGQCCRFAHELDAAFVFSLGIDYNCYPDLQGRARWPIPALYRWGVRHADAVLAQTRMQAGLMQANFGRADVQVLPNFLEIHEPRTPDEDLGYALWVGSLARRKRPEIFLELARRFPQTEFRLVGGPGEDMGFDGEIRGLARQIPNLNFVGFVPPPEMDSQYRGAAVYVNTSRLEGLPNALLQSWAHAVPTLTAGIDPDGVIRRKRLGGVGETLDELTEALRHLLHASDARREAGLRGHLHVRENHAMESIGDLAVSYFEGALARRRNGRRN